MSYVNVETLLKRIEGTTTMSDEWHMTIPTISTSDLINHIKRLSQDLPSEPKSFGITEREAWEKISEMYAPASPEELMEILNDYFNIQQPKTPTTSNPKASLHSDITKELNDIYIAKNADYGDAFGETYKKLGVISAVTRITDKVNRLQSLATKSDEERLVKDESIVDTLKDLSNYALMTLIEMGYEPEVVEDSHSINAGGSSLNEMDIDLNEAMKAFARIGGQ